MIVKESNIIVLTYSHTEEMKTKNYNYLESYFLERIEKGFERKGIEILKEDIVFFIGNSLTDTSKYYINKNEATTKNLAKISTLHYCSGITNNLTIIPTECSPLEIITYKKKSILTHLIFDYPKYDNSVNVIDFLKDVLKISLFGIIDIFDAISINAKTMFPHQVILNTNHVTIDTITSAVLSEQINGFLDLNIIIGIRR